MSFFIVEVDNEGFKVLDSSGTQINPAEDATVAAITTELQAIQNTTGIKAIIDPLPAGTNNIGDVDIASALPAGSNIIGTVKLVDTAGINLLAIDGSGRVAIQNPPNLDVAASTLATESTLGGVETEVQAVRDRIGEVSASPTANTVQARLELIRALLATIDADTGNLDVALSTRATETTLAGVETEVQAVRDRIGEISASPTANTLQARLEQIRALLATIDSDTSNLDVALSTRATEATLDAIRDNIGEAVGAPVADTLMARVQEVIDFLNAEDFASETTLSSIESLITTIDTVLDNIYARQADKTQFTQITDGTNDAVVDSSGDLQVIHTDPLPSGTNEIGAVAQGTKAANTGAWPLLVVDSSGNEVSVINDAGVYRFSVTGKVQITGSSPPPATNPVQINASAPLTVGSHDTTFTIPNGETFFLQEIVCGNEDPTKGAVILVIFNNGTEHVIARVYTNGQTIQVGYSDVEAARDGTALVGNGTNTIIVRRVKYSGSDIAIDAVVSGYTV